MTPEFGIYFDMTGSAFDEYPEYEVVRIIRKIADQIEAGNDCGVIKCINGNTLGDWYMDNNSRGLVYG